jgi:hypothetical protein
MRPGEGLVFQSKRLIEDADGMHIGWQNVLSKRLESSGVLVLWFFLMRSCFGTPGGLVDENGG